MKLNPKQFAVIREARRLAATDPSVLVALDEFNRRCPGLGAFSGADEKNFKTSLRNLCEAVFATPADESAVTTEIARGAMKFNADAQLDMSKPDASPLAEKPIKIVARTGGVAMQAYWGRCVHDMSGFIPPDGPVPLDYGHCDDVDPGDAIGVADTVAVVDGQLVATGRLIPFAPDDTASQVIAKGAAGVPFQASINMDMPSLQVLEVPSGQSIEVNGATFIGPGVVFTQWSVNGIAICLYGADSATSVQFRRLTSMQQLQMVNHDVSALFGRSKS